MLEKVAGCFAERRPTTRTDQGGETMVYVHLFKGDSIGKVGPFLWEAASFQQLERPDDELLFFRLWVGEHRSSVLTSQLLLDSFREHLKDPAFHARVLKMADELGSRREVEASAGGAAAAAAGPADLRLPAAFPAGQLRPVRSRPSEGKPAAGF